MKSSLPAGLHRALFLFLLGLCLLPVIGTATALIMGAAFSLAFGNPWPKHAARGSKILLQLSVVGLGFGLGLGEVLRTGRDSLTYTLAGIAAILLVGTLLGRLYKTEANTSLLISFGTAICGGSAIAALAPVVKARDDETAVALATVFTLNSVALLLFPLIGHLLELDQPTFGAWAALAIHDTSSVVGAASAYGAQALAVATPVKLTRAIWITPAVIAIALYKKSGQKTGIPLFIIGFLLAAAARTLLPQYGQLWALLVGAAKQGLTVTLFLVGAGLSRDVLRRVGARPLLQGITLWLLASVCTLGALLTFGLA